jgi:DNA-binding winged helix-turn-helix (wHTH) protein
MDEYPARAVLGERLGDLAQLSSQIEELRKLLRTEGVVA